MTYLAILCYLTFVMQNSASFGAMISKTDRANHLTSYTLYVQITVSQSVTDITNCTNT